uniref:Uncharacterized protein n=1 Tax=Oryza brachyantha TaxID=4533 RepID=J3MSC6_ORYBR
MATAAGGGGGGGSTAAANLEAPNGELEGWEQLGRGMEELSSLGLGLQSLQLRVQENSGKCNGSAYHREVMQTCGFYQRNQWTRNKDQDEMADLPRELIGETGVLKNRTDVTMTTTRLTQLPTECVTGDTLARIM